MLAEFILALSWLFSLFPATRYLAHEAPTAPVEAKGDLISQYVPGIDQDDFSQDWGCTVTLQDPNNTGEEVREDIADPETKQVAQEVARDEMGSTKIDGAGSAPDTITKNFVGVLQEGATGAFASQVADEVRARAAAIDRTDDASKLLHGTSAISKSCGAVSVIYTNMIGAKIPMRRLYPSSVTNVQELSRRIAFFWNQLGSRTHQVQLGANVISAIHAQLCELHLGLADKPLAMKLGEDGKILADWLYGGHEGAWDSEADVVRAWKEKDFIASDWHLKFSTFYNPLARRNIVVFHVLHPNRANHTGWGKRWIQVN